jgi:hypothetical protein
LESNIISFLPIILMQSIYAILTVQIARRTNRSVPTYLIILLIPLIGAFFFVYVMWSTVLFVLDSINELKVQNDTPRQP